MRLSVEQFSKVCGAGGKIPTNETVGNVYYDKMRNKYCFDVGSNEYDKVKKCYKRRDVAMVHCMMCKNPKNAMR